MIDLPTTRVLVRQADNFLVAKGPTVPDRFRLGFPVEIINDTLTPVNVRGVAYWIMNYTDLEDLGYGHSH